MGRAVNATTSGESGRQFSRTEAADIKHGGVIAYGRSIIKLGERTFGTRDVSAIIDEHRAAGTTARFFRGIATERGRNAGKAAAANQS